MIDFHTHILPGIDDGSAFTGESVALIKMLKEQGVDKILLTPHFYAYASSVESFLERRESSAKKLLAELEKDSADVELYLGCEVLYFNELWRIEDLEQLCISGTRYILVEMPFSKWTDTMIDCIEKIVAQGFTPVIAHFERYIPYGNMEKIRLLTESGALLQMNCEYINNFFSRRKAVNLIKKNVVWAIGTDCHNTKKRAPEYARAVKYLSKKLSEGKVRKITCGPEMILHRENRVYPSYD